MQTEEGKNARSIEQKQNRSFSTNATLCYESIFCINSLASACKSAIGNDMDWITIAYFRGSMHLHFTTILPPPPQLYHISLALTLLYYNMYLCSIKFHHNLFARYRTVQLFTCQIIAYLFYHYVNFLYSSAKFWQWLVSELNANGWSKCVYIIPKTVI